MENQFSWKFLTEADADADAASGATVNAQHTYIKVDRFLFNDCATYTKGIGTMADDDDDHDDEYNDDIKRTHDMYSAVCKCVSCGKLIGWLAGWHQMPFHKKPKMTFQSNSMIQFHLNF